jgi:membrane protease YdiL (CAAX protease family)
MSFDTPREPAGSDPPGSDSAPSRAEFGDPFATAAVAPRPTPVERIVALLEVLLCSDYPTQLALGATLVAFGLHTHTADGSLDVTYVVVLSLVDTVVLLGLIAFFLSAHGESMKEMVLGSQPVRREMAAGTSLAIISLLLAVGVLATIQQVAPRLHNIEGNPLQDLIRTPREAELFAFVIVVAGGIREEIQRAFLLRRFERWLGGGPVGVVITSVGFGAGHLLQGADAAITTGILGAFWGVVYLRRRSAVAPIVSHSGFNLLQLGQFLVLGR